MEMTHKQAVRRIGNWLKNSRQPRCNIVVAELSTMCHETPDVIGFHGAGGSILVECKVSRSDFLSDKTKSFRNYPEFGMGDVRYFAAPPSIIFPDDDLGNWGQLEIREHQIRVVREPKPQAACKRSEVKLLMSAIRRLEISTAVFVREPTDEMPLTPLAAEWEASRTADRCGKQLDGTRRCFRPADHVGECLF